MTEITLTDAESRLSELVHRAKAGETILITESGQAVARLTALDVNHFATDAQEAVDHLRHIRTGTTLGGLDARELFASGRR